MIEDQGEAAIVIEVDKKMNSSPFITNLILAKENRFDKKELKHIFLTASLEKEQFKEKKAGDKEVLRSYLTSVYDPEIKKESGSSIYLQVEEMKHDAVRSIKSYKQNPKKDEKVLAANMLVQLDKEDYQKDHYTPVAVFAGKKYKKVADKIKPIIGELPSEYRIERKIIGDPLADMPKLNPNPPDFVPTGRYTAERKEIIDKVHNDDFLWSEERKLMHHFMMLPEQAFAWTAEERGRFRHDFFPPVKMPVIPHTPWVERNIPIPPGIFEEVCRIIKEKIDAGVYEPSNSSYRTRWFCVTKKDGKSLRIVHSLEPLNAVTIQHSGVPPATEELAERFCGRACGGVLDMFVGYDNRDLDIPSRDMTTFQTPFGPLRLTKIPMGWTDSVPIFHDDVNYVEREEIPEYTQPYIDDVPVRGPATRYELPDGGYETIPENSGIRRFVWEHFQNMNRIVQRMKYAGGSFSGLKAVLCASEFLVVGHLCSYEGRKISKDRMSVITNWPPCKDLHEVRGFLGTAGLVRMFIKDYAEIAAPLQNLTKKDVPFHWGKEQEEAMEELKEAVKNSGAIRPLEYLSDAMVILNVDTSYIAVGFYICQEDLDNPKIRYYARFGSITLNEREAKYSQPKRELYGLFRALKACHYWLFGVRNLKVETDAKYIKGMLQHPDMMPNATINRWIESILMFHFKLEHIPGLRHGSDGLSRRRSRKGDEEYEVPEDGIPDEPYRLEEFIGKIDTKGGYLQNVGDKQDLFWNTEGVFHLEQTFLCDLARAVENEKDLYAKMEVSTLLNREVTMPEFADVPEGIKDLEYLEEHRSQNAKNMDRTVDEVRTWLKDTSVRPKGYEKELKFKNFLRIARNYFCKNEKLYKRDVEGNHKLVVPKERRTSVMKAAHDSLGHRMFFATKSLLSQRFWWPEMEKDIYQYVRTCHVCQTRQKVKVKIPPTETRTPSLFQVMHMDTMRMESSNGCKYLVHGRDALTSWMEGRPLRRETGRTIGQWIWEDILCRWGSLV